MTQKKEYAFSILIRDAEKAIKENIENGTLWELDNIIDNYNRNKPHNAEIICEGCGEPITIKRKNKKYHNSACKQRAFRMK